MTTTTPQIHFEGPEKRLLIWFDLADQHDTLRTLISKEKWAVYLKGIGCEILSVQQSKSIDAYVLSESSLFVYDNFMMIKTCGQTTLLNILKPIRNVIKDSHLSLDRLVFSRKCYLKPEEQHELHRSWDAELKTLYTFFDSYPASGTIQCVASKETHEKRDNWHAFHWLNQRYKPTPSKRLPITFEVLMHDLAPESMEHYFSKNVPLHSGKAAGDFVTIKSGIDQLIPETHIDAFQFEPCGYSMNGLVDDKHYSTIHITPEDFCSYVSFETNYRDDTNEDFFGELTQRCIQCFKPGRFMVTAFDPNAVPDMLNVHPPLSYNRSWSERWFEGIMQSYFFTKTKPQDESMLDFSSSDSLSSQSSDNCSSDDEF